MEEKAIFILPLKMGVTKEMKETLYTFTMSKLKALNPIIQKSGKTKIINRRKRKQSNIL